MKLLLFLTSISLLISPFTLAYDIDLPEGYELCDLFEDDETVEYSASSHHNSYGPILGVPWHKNPAEKIKSQESSGENVAMAVLEAGPSATVAGCVHALSGTFFESDVDFVVPGAQPLIVQHAYSSGDKEWTFRHLPVLEVFETEGAHHLNAGYKDGMGGGMSYHAKKHGLAGAHKLDVAPDVYENGLTNCGSGRISGQTNWKNSSVYFIKKQGEKQYIVDQGSTARKLFTQTKTYGKKHSKGAPKGKFQVSREYNLNGNSLQYDYIEGKGLVLVKALNRGGESLGSLCVSRDDYQSNWFCDGGSVTYRFKSKDSQVLNIFNPNGKNITFNYDDKGYLVRKIMPEGRYLKIDYKRSDGKTRVVALSAPVGADSTPITTHTFTYLGNKNRGATLVHDAEGYLTKYYQEDMRLSEIVHYDREAVISRDHFYWGYGPDEGNLISRFFEGDGNCAFCRRFTYDPFGNVIHDELLGNLTGLCEAQVIVNKYGIPKRNGCEVYSKTHVYSQDNRNLLLEEDDGEKTVVNFHNHGTNLLSRRFTKADDKILKREFYTYDINGIVIEEITDDGITDDRDDLTGVTERHVKRITPTSEFPIGLPGVVEDFYFADGELFLLKREINSYTIRGKLKHQEHYGSDGVLAYTLQWDYNDMDLPIKEVNALGEEALFDYDGNGNKIYEFRANVETRYTYDLANRLIKEEVVWADGQSFITTHRYNTLSQKVATTDPSGNETTFTYDALGRLSESHYPPIYNFDGTLSYPVSRTDYDSMGNPIKVWDGNGYCTKSQFTIRGQPFRVEYPDGSVETMEYTLCGRLKKKTAKNGLVTLYMHDALGRVIKTDIVAPDGTVLKSSSSDYSSFQLLSEIDEEGVVTTYGYDKAGRKISTKKGGRTTHYEYDVLGRVSKIIEHVDSSTASVYVKCYDLLDRVIEERAEDSKGNLYTQEKYIYDELGRRTQTIAFTQAGEAISVTLYNPHGDPVKIIDALGNETYIEYVYDYMYNGLHVLHITKTDPLGNQEITIHDTSGNAVCNLRRNAFGKVLQHETHFYDCVGQRLLTESLLPRSIITEWKYDSLGNVTKLTEACGTPDQRVTRFGFNSYGQKETALTPNGITITYTYDSLGRLKTLESSDGTVYYTYIYDIKDRPITVNDQIHSTVNTRVYDELGHLRSETLDNGQTLTYDYDVLDRCILVTLPDSSSIRYLYDAYDLKEIERIKNGTVSYTHSYLKRDLSGNIISEKLLGNSGTINHTYDLLQRSIEISSPDWHETISKGGFDAAGNLLERHVVDAKGSLTYTYAYDDLYQIIDETGICHHSYQNDALFNRIKKDGEDYSFNDLNQLLSQSDWTYRYDRNGNLKEKVSNDKSLSFFYDGLDRLIEVKDGRDTIKYLYDSYHRRIGKSLNGAVTHFIYDGQNEIGAVNDGKFTQFRVLGATHGAEIGAAVALELDGVIYAPIHDPCGNVVALVDDTGKCIETYRYTAFGETTDYTSLINNPWKYSSKRFDPETGFIYFGRRYYAPDVGRWITPDPAGFADGLNLYAYVHNDPMAYIDPDGQLAFLLLPMAISFAIDLCLPTAAVLAETYLGGTMAAAFVIGMANGYNGDFFSPSGMEGIDVGTAISEKAGMCIGALVMARGNPIKAAQSATSAVGRSLVKAGADITKKSVTNLVEGGTKKVVSTAASKTAQLAEKQLVKREVAVVERACQNKVGNTGAISSNLKDSSRLRFKPDPRAVGAHTVFRRNGATGEISHYETFIRQTNNRNPNPWETSLRYDGTGCKSHFNSVLDKYIDAPHIHDPLAPGGLRYPQPIELPF